MSNMLQKFGEAVKKRRKSLDLTQEDLAFKANIDTRSIIAIESGQRNPTLKTIHRLTEALKTDSATLIPF